MKEFGEDTRWCISMGTELNISGLRVPKWGRGLGSSVNASGGSEGNQANVEFVEHDGCIYLSVIVDFIEAGEELFACYGSTYWNSRRHTQVNCVYIELICGTNFGGLGVFHSCGLDLHKSKYYFSY